LNLVGSHEYPSAGIHDWSSAPVLFFKNSD